MRRREFLKRGLALTAAAALAKDAIAEALITRAPSHPALPNLDRLTGHVILRGDPDYEEARIGRNTDTCSFPAVIVFARRSTDVVRAVNWAREHGVPLRVRCGRHSYEGFSAVDDGIVIDVHDLRHIHYNPQNRRVTVGSGMSLAKLYEGLWKHKVTVPGGSCPTVGVAGHTLGGGYGLLARHFGLACDSLREVELVTAAGKIIRATEHDHTDLLWASRGGGGGNFGIATSFVFDTHPIDNVSIFSLDWKFSDLDAVLDAWQNWAPTVDHRLSSILVLKSQANGSLSAIGQFVGPLDEMKTLLAPLINAGYPQTSMETLTFMDAMLSFSGQTPGRDRWKLHWSGENSHFKNSSDYADKLLTVEGRAILKHALETAPGPACLIQFEAYGGAIDNLATDTTAFVHRAGTLFNMQYQAYWGKSQDRAPFAQWVEDTRRSMQPHVSGRAYSNYCDSLIDDWPRAYYGQNLARLESIKKRYDHHGLFNFPQSIPVVR
jgi:FAD/FMN-containing dehydrogenase